MRSTTKRRTAFIHQAHLLKKYLITAKTDIHLGKDLISRKQFYLYKVRTSSFENINVKKFNLNLKGFDLNMKLLI